jgi:PAS domain S-box-containing protein
MTDLIPELTLVIGDQPPAPELPPKQAQTRFQLMFRSFIGAFSRPEHPLALFLDDLQWLDVATLDLLDDLLTRSDLQHVMLIGAYRDNEVSPTHPFMRKLDAIKAAGGRIVEIRLAPLAREHLGQLIADALRCEPERAAPLAELVHGKTGGNPFFAMQFLSSLAEEALITFDHHAACWSWDLDRIHAKGYTDNVADLMVGKLIRLPAAAQNALQQLACLGNIAEIATLSVVLGISEEQVDEALWPTRRQELVERIAGTYRFVHDRVQEAAYSMIGKELRVKAHLRIGRLLAAHTPPEKREEAIFDIVNQLNRGASLITSTAEREQLAEFNLFAGRRAKASTAYVSALTYLTTGVALLPEDAWQRRREIALALELNRAECEFLTGALAEAERRLAALSTRAVNTVERATVACLRMDLYVTLGQSSRTIAVGLEYLRHQGIDWSPHPIDEEVRLEYERIWSRLESRTIEDLIELPLMTDPACLATMDVLMYLGPAAMHLDANLLALCNCRSANLSLEHGYNDTSCVAFVAIGLIAGPRFGDYQAGYRFGRLGCDLVERHRLKRFHGRTSMIFGNQVLPWTEHVRAGRDLVRRAFETANNMGDLTYAAYCGTQLTTNLLAAGDPLIEAQREAKNALAFAQKARFGLVIDRCAIQLALIRTLRGLTPTFGSFDDESFDELGIERRFSENPDLATAEYCYWLRKQQGRFFAGKCTEAIEASSCARRLLRASPSVSETAEYHFYGALSRAASCEAAPADQRQEHIDALAAHHRQLQLWARHCPQNFENCAAMVGAEIARIEGREVDATRLYERAIHSARENGFVHNQALAYELAARFYAARGFKQIANLYLRSARYGYLRWGAVGKVRQLDETYPDIRQEDSLPGPTSTIGAPVEHLDLATVIRASQAVSSEIVLGNLIKTLLRIAIEHAGAERGLLILFKGDEPQIAAEATTARGQVEVTLRQTAVSPADIPESVLHYVIRTRDRVILDDALAHNPFSADEYICQKHARSVLCLPLVKQSMLIGLLYLENNLASHVFTPARISVLELLASQAAISLENARLYNDLTEREARIRRLVDSNIIGIFIGDSRGGVLEANEAFLDILGYSREDLISGRIRWTKLTPAEWAPADQDALAQMSATGSCKPFEKEYFRKDGSRVPVLVGGAFFDVKRDEEVVFVIDMTDRKRAEQALRESEERFRTLVQFSFDVYWESDARHRFIRQEFAEGLADPRAPGSEIGKTRWEVPHLEPDAEAWRKHRETLEAHLPFRDFELARPAADGGKRYISVSGLPMFDKAGRFIGYRGVARHITERKRAEEALRDMQMQLAHANRVATMGQLSASITHEVKQPIGAARNNARAALNFLDNDPPDLDEVREALGCIVGDANRAGDIVDRIRGLFKKAPPRKECLDINAGIREVIELTRGEWVKNGISMQADLADGLPFIEGDRVQLQQVLLNLIVNAVEAMSGASDGTRELLVSSRVDAGGVLVGVRDTGPGLAPKTLEHVFEAFYTTKPGGLGMGLSICRSIIEAHGGRLWASANLPRGASFQFALPAIANTAS